MEPRRARRRRLTLRVAHRRLAVHNWIDHVQEWPRQGSWAFVCRCERTGPWFWSTHRPLSCRCSKRKPGVPRHNRGMCHVGRRYRVYAWRAQVRELNRTLARGHRPDDDEVSTLAAPHSVSKTGLWKA